MEQLEFDVKALHALAVLEEYYIPVVPVGHTENIHVLQWLD